MIGTADIGGKRGPITWASNMVRQKSRRVFIGATGLTARAPRQTPAPGSPDPFMAAAFKVDRVANWSAWKTNPDDYLVKNYDAVRILCHTEGRHQGINQKAERFTEPNRGWTVKMELDRAKALGLGVHLCLDFYHGSGRADDDGSHTGPGRYHYTWAEGGMRDAINDCFSWMPGHVVSFCVGNEPRDVAWLANQYDQFWMSHARAKCKARGIPLVGYDGNFLGPMFAKWCDWIDVHAIGSTGGKAGKKIRDARRLGRPVVMFEFSAAKIEQYHSELLAGLNEGPLSMGAFPNSPEFEHEGFVEWNINKPHAQFGHTYRGGITRPGGDWSKVLGSGPTDPPVDPPPPIDPPPPPPGNAPNQTVLDARWVRERIVKKGECMGENRQANCIERLDAIIERESA
jgi:hypothetical protein